MGNGEKYAQFTAEEIKDERAVKYKGLTMLKPKDFDKYREEHGKTVVVVRNTRLEVAKEKHKDKCDTMVVKGTDEKEDTIYEVSKEKSHWTKGYVSVGESRFVRVERRVWLFLALLLACVIGGVGLWLALHQSVEDPQLDKTRTKHNGEVQQNSESSTEAVDATVIPKFYTIKAKEGQTVQLYNPEENTVYFTYRVLETTGRVDMEHFDTQAEAAQYVADNKVQYRNEVQNGKCVIVDENGESTEIVTNYSMSDAVNGVDVYKTDYKVVYCSAAIAPGNKVDWVPSKSLSRGKHDVQISIIPYDLETEQQCYGTTSDVKVTIE